jgi:hypothetical protein
MFMMSFEWGLVGTAVAALGLLFVGAQWAFERQRVIQQGRVDLQKFTSATVGLINDPKTPNAIAEFLTRNASDATQPYMARWFAARIKDGTLFQEEREPASDKGREFQQAFRKLDESQKQAFAQCFAYCLMSSAACDPFRATAIRNIIQFGMFEYRTPRVNDTEKARAIVVEYSRSHLDAPARHRLFPERAA